MEPGEPVDKFAYETVGVRRSCNARGLFFSCARELIVVPFLVPPAQLPRGFWDDFKFYTNQHHPLFVMLFADPVHPYSTKNRQAEFAGAFFTT